MLVPFLRERPAALMLALKDSSKEWHISALSKETGLTYLHTLNMLAQLHNIGLVDYRVDGRKKIVVLTEKGKNAASMLSQLMAVLKES